MFDLPQSHFDPLGTTGGFGDPRRAPGAPPSAFTAPPPAYPSATPGPPSFPTGPEVGPSGLVVPPPPREMSPPRGYGGPPTLSSAAQLGATPERRLMSPQIGSSRPPPPPTMVSSLPVMEPEAGATGVSMPSLTAIASTERPATMVEDGPSTSFFSPAQENATTVGAPASQNAGEEEVSTGPTTNGGGSADPAEDHAYATHIREVFEAYVATRRRCGETVATLTLDKFQARLETNRQQLVAKYGCRSARFSVYVKDGKAAVKATPLR